MSVRLPEKHVADVFLRLLWMLQIFPPGCWLKPRRDGMAGDEARDMYLTLWTLFAGAAPAFGVGISSFVAVAGDFICYTPYRSRSFLHEPWTTADTAYLTLALAGLVLRLWALRVFALHQLGIINDHQLMQTGPYCLIRHPGHMGTIVGLFGYAAFVGLRPPGLIWVLIFALPLSFYMARIIPYEEQVLHQHFGQEWEQYCKRTWALIPVISQTYCFLVNSLTILAKSFLPKAGSKWYQRHYWLAASDGSPRLRGIFLSTSSALLSEGFPSRPS